MLEYLRSRSAESIAPGSGAWGVERAAIPYDGDGGNIGRDPKQLIGEIDTDALTIASVKSGPGTAAHAAGEVIEKLAERTAAYERTRVGASSGSCGIAPRAGYTVRDRA